MWKKDKKMKKLIEIKKWKNGEEENKHQDK